MEGEKMTSKFIEEALRLMRSRESGYLDKDVVYRAVTGVDFSRARSTDSPQVRIDREDQEKVMQIIRAFGRPMKELPIYFDWKKKHGDWPEDTKYYFQHIDRIENDFAHGRDISSSVEGLIDAILQD
jgi:hypothetical protein